MFDKKAILCSMLNGTYFYYRGYKKNCFKIKKKVIFVLRYMYFFLFLIYLMLEFYCFQKFWIKNLINIFFWKSFAFLFLIYFNKITCLCWLILTSATLCFEKKSNQYNLFFYFCATLQYAKNLEVDKLFWNPMEWNFF